MSKLLHTLVQDIHAGDILSLLDELEHAIPVVSRTALRIPLVNLLTQFVYPKGFGKREPIKLDLALHTPILETPIGKFPDGDLRSLCTELAATTEKALEFYHGSKMYVFLNKTLPKYAMPRQPTALQKRWDAVTRQRRANR